jgi:hypothetical protein
VIGAVQSKNLPVEPEPSRHFNLLFTVEGSGIQGRFRVQFGKTCTGECVKDDQKSLKRSRETILLPVIA